MIKKNIVFFLCLNFTTFIFSVLVINNPGSYRIPNDLSYTPTGPNDSIILINSSDVTIDFQDHKLSLTTDNTFPDVDGIVINTNLSNILISNLNIQNISGVGIHILDGCSNINIYDSSIQSCNAAGIFFDGSASGTGITGNVINNCQVVSCTGAAGNAAYGIRMVNNSLNKISNSHAAFNDAITTNSAYGIYIENTTAFQINNTTAVGNGGTNFVAGIAIIQSFTGIIENVTIYKNECRLTGSACGFFLDEAQDIYLENCKSSANINNASTAIGFLAQNGKQNVFKNCLAELNTGDTYAAGFKFDGEQKSKVIDSIIQEQKTLTSGTAYGVVLANNCDKCFIMNNKITNNIGASSSFGINDERSESTSVVIRNYAFNNGTNYSVTYPLTITLPILSASLSSSVPGIPTGVAGVFDNISIDP